MKPYYSAGGVDVYLGDNRDVVPNLAVRPSLIFTSPPYNKGLRVDGKWAGVPTASSKSSRFRQGYGAHCSDAMPMSEYVAWQRDSLRLFWDALTPDGAIYYNHKPRIQNGTLSTPLDYNPGLPLRQIIVWYCGAGINLMPGAYCPAHEWIMVLAKPGFRLKSKRHSAVSDVWQFRSVHTKAHPAPMPLGVALRAIDTTRDDAPVLDPYAGTGTTLAAAKMRGRPAVGIDTNEEYCEMMARRLDQTAREDA